MVCMPCLELSRGLPAAPLSVWGLGGVSLGRGRHHAGRHWVTRTLSSNSSAAFCFLVLTEVFFLSTPYKWLCSLMLKLDSQVLKLDSLLEELDSLPGELDSLLNSPGGLLGQLRSWSNSLGRVLQTEPPSHAWRSLEAWLAACGTLGRQGALIAQ